MIGPRSLAGTLWSPQSQVKAVICLVHGLGEHIGRYAHVASFFNNSHYALMGVDLPGHGKSPGKRGHLGPYTHIMDVVEGLIDKARSIFPAVPCFLYGHSMGGNIVLNALARHNLGLTGAVVTSPWLRLSIPLPRALVVVTEILNRVYPSFAQPNGLSSTHLSHDNDVVANYESDPLVHNRISVQTYVELSRAADWVMNHAGNIEVPLLLMHGSADSITDHSASAELAEGVGGNCTFQSWEGLYHELHNEVERDWVLEYIREWLDRRQSG